MISNGSLPIMCQEMALANWGQIAVKDLILVELFSGCGGFSLGAHQAGFKVAAAFDIDPVLTSSYRFNFPETQLHLGDIAGLDGSNIQALVGKKIDGIIGGPPCQGFSDIGRRRADDPRRQLVGHFFRLVAELQPSFFVMENVRGLAYSDARGVLDQAVALLDDRYQLLGPLIWDAATFGAATKRSRLFVIGFHRDLGMAMAVDDLNGFRRKPATVRQAIFDLKDAESFDEIESFDFWKIVTKGRRSDYARCMSSPDGLFTGHRRTNHSQSVVSRFKSVAPGEIDSVGRHPRLKWEGQCPTLRAGTGSDLGSYQSVRPIHPDEPRVITVREAARLQGFPDSFRFHPTVWHSFRMIGNSVCPIIAKVIFSALSEKLSNVKRARID